MYVLTTRTSERSEAPNLQGIRSNSNGKETNELLMNCRGFSLTPSLSIDFENSRQTDILFSLLPPHLAFGETSSAG
jgi:hypothetical protein